MPLSPISNNSLQTPEEEDWEPATACELLLGISVKVAETVAPIFDDALEKIFSLTEELFKIKSGQE